MMFDGSIIISAGVLPWRKIRKETTITWPIKKQGYIWTRCRNTEVYLAWIRFGSFCMSWGIPRRTWGSSMWRGRTEKGLCLHLFLRFWVKRASGPEDIFHRPWFRIWSGSRSMGNGFRRRNLQNWFKKFRKLLCVWRQRGIIALLFLRLRPQ